jgi:hypothetical protein
MDGLASIMPEFGSSKSNSRLQVDKSVGCMGLYFLRQVWLEGLSELCVPSGECRLSLSRGSIQFNEARLYVYT